MLIKKGRKHGPTIWRRLGLYAVPVTLFFLLLLGLNPKATMREAALRMGWAGLGHENKADLDLDLVTTSAGNLARAAFHESELPTLTFDIKFKHVLKLRTKRREALAAGYLIQGSDDYVPADLKHGGRSVKVRLRLKGDYLDHLDTRKWSVRVHVRNGDSVMGMRRFSLHHPKARSYQAEFLFLDALRREDILAPRYKLVHAVVNGEDIGLMAFEEHFSKELLESQERREGVILKFEEDLVWLARVAGFEQAANPYYGHQNATVDAFRKSKIAESPQLTLAHRIATGLLRAFVQGRLEPSQVFDTKRLGRFLALCELFGARHALVWHNLRFYYDPIAGRLEPIGFDAQAQDSLQSMSVVQEPWVATALADPSVESAYRAALARFTETSNLKRIIERAKLIETQVLDDLHWEFPMLRRFDFDRIARRAGELPSTGGPVVKPTTASKDVRSTAYPLLAHCYIVEDAGERYIELVNAVPEQVDVRAITMEGDNGEVADSGLLEQPHKLLPLKIGGEPTSVTFQIGSRGDLDSSQLRVHLAIRGGSETQVVTPRAYWPALEDGPVPEATLAAALATHNFLVASGSSELRVRRGSWTVDAPLVVPAGMALLISADTTLSFAPGTFLLARGPLRFAGTAEGPIRLQGLRSESDSDGWGGVVVLNAAGPSDWSHVYVNGTRGVDLADWKVPAGVTFLESRVRLDECVFDGTQAEDALNLIRCEFAFRGLHMRNTTSDAFDSDFCTGTIDGGSLVNIGQAGGGDGLDFSGSEVRFTGIKFSDVQDKAVSVGEASRVFAERLDITRVGCGLAAKDGSVLEVSDTSISGATVSALMAYMKKPVFGPAQIRASGMRISNAHRDAWTQTRSSILLNGVEVPAEELDVEKLYETSMRKASGGK